MLPYIIIICMIIALFFLLKTNKLTSDNLDIHDISYTIQNKIPIDSNLNSNLDTKLEIISNIKPSLPDNLSNYVLSNYKFANVADFTQT